MEQEGPVSSFLYTATRNGPTLAQAPDVAFPTRTRRAPTLASCNWKLVHGSVLGFRTMSREQKHGILFVISNPDTDIYKAEMQGRGYA